MVEHVQSIPERIGQSAARSGGDGESLRQRVLAWALREALLFPIVALFLVTMVSNLPRELLSDTWFAILGGHEIVHHGLPAQDTLTVWSHGKDWIDQQWLGQFALYGLYALGGLKLVLLGHAVAVGSAFVLALTFARRRGGTTRSISWLALPAIFLLIWGSWNARAQSLAFVLFVAIVWLLAADARAPSRKVLWVFPLLILWANVHGSAVTGALLVLVAGLSYAVGRRREPKRSWLPRTALLCVAPIACLFVSPYAVSLPHYYRHVLVNSSFRDYILEWRPTALDFQTSPFYLLAFLAVWLIGKRGERLSTFEKALLALTAVMGLQTMRMVVWFALAVNRVLVAVSIAGTITAFTAVAARPGSWLERDYPDAALAAVERADSAQPGVRLFANEQYADWLLLRDPNLRGRVAFDIRFELLSRKQIQSIVDVRRQVEGWRKTVSPYGLYVLKKGPDSLVIKGLLRDRNARKLYTGQGLVVISRASER
jgi:hypothetical protein